MLKDLIKTIEKQHLTPKTNDIIVKNKNVAGKFSYIDDSNGLWSYVAKQSLIQDKDDRLQSVVDGGYIHSTMFPELCPRQISLHRFTKIPVQPRSLSYNDKLTWAIGRALEELNRSELMTNVGRKAIIGKWTCSCKNNPVTVIHDYNTGKRGEYIECKFCGNYPDKYHEPTITLPDYHAVCNPDLAYFNQYNQVAVWELKSIKEKTSGQLQGFKDLEEPQAKNKQQALMQHLFIKKAGHDVADYVNVHYTSKAHTGFKMKPWKEYKVLVNDSKLMYTENEKLLELGKIIKVMDKDGLVNGSFPEKVAGEQCKNCQMKALCKGIG